MERILRFFPYYRDLPDDNYIERQRFIIYFYFSLIAFLSGIFFYFQTAILFKDSSITPYILIGLTVTTALNMFLMYRLGNARLAYAAIISIGFICIHTITYKAGGIYSPSNYFIGVLAIATFFLLGKKAGWVYLVFAFAHTFLITYFTIQGYTVDAYTGKYHGSDEWDVFTLVVLSVFVIVFLCVGLEKSKNLILDSAKKSNEKVKEYAESLERINNDLDRFAYIVSHDLKAPLRAIGHLSQWIEDDLEGNIKDETRENLEMMRQRVNRMENLINGILQYSKINRTENNNEDISVRELLNDVLFLLSPQENIKVEIKGAMPYLSGDKTKLQQVFSNIIGNAIKYNDKEQAHIEIFCNDRKDDYEFTISDNGPGIEKNHHDKIFIIFHTLQSRDMLESTGVGLAIVKKIIEDGGGEIRVDSEKGKGAKFIFTIPKKSARQMEEDFYLKYVA